ncbi:hypothetical protein ABZ070_02280 [Streptomyces sp. NPDC006283]|uniref:hypothetical protein n=1 Tax=Streptomyces sp. NPDC006283 TaxID=3156741 RepID=UPI0033B190E5
MTETEIVMLLVGIIVGAQLALVVHLVGEYRGNRRVARAGAAALAQARKRHTTADWREALARRPTLAEVAQAEVRDFELGLLNGLDRVEDAARREGLL